ncbi:hypothetical protein GALMADRAFT_158848 [Galerina marginata CBS 339.88]|uniref:Fungal-type protein kinase domain-containing protein n=1 Tax=Galerina marginata (strain CBS 339.88) TaxID=685588 RepID=A0A067SP25_GALM3|nr:hypothetical protein GALMADRAFT_158848 [Galerina marginata CBS 339.88]
MHTERRDRTLLGENDVCVNLPKRLEAKDVGPMEPAAFLDRYLPESDTLEKEGDIYSIQEDKHVSYTAPFGRGNDVRNHVTHTDTYRDTFFHNVYPTKAMGPLHHYRMSSNKIGRRLVDFASMREFVKAIADALEAHQCSYDDAQILHRDIRDGLLIDWDLCLNMTKQPTEARRPERTRTWQFMSKGLLADPRKVQDVQDDEESSLYVLTWIALRYTRHSHLADLLNLLKLFDEVDVGKNTRTGGQRKEYFLLNGTPVRFTDRPSLDELNDELRLHFHELYHLPKPTDDQLAEVKAFQQMGMTKSLHLNLAYRYDYLQNRLKNRKWLVETFRKHLATYSWPNDDASCLNKNIFHRRN